MTASAWADPPGHAYLAARNEQLPVATQLRQCGHGAVAAAPSGSGHPAMAALRCGDEPKPWELTGLPNRYSTSELLFISSSWELLHAGSGEEAES